MKRHNKTKVKGEMKNRFCIYVFFLALLAMCGMAALPAQEALKSAEEDYYDFLALQGLAARPYLNYRTLSDSAWQIQEGAEHTWQGQNLGTWLRLFGDARLRIYGPELFTSFNTAAPYGQNDGALWQGRGFNASLTSGFRLEGYGVELTFRPQLAFSQNWAFNIMAPEGMQGGRFTEKSDTYGYFWGVVDAPQRFGDEPFFTWDWGDSEVRYTWKTLTIGFGTQAIWLGPSYLNSILHSNNAPTYPKLDIGLRRQRVTIPWLGWYIGDVEARLWVGYLSESDYFDDDNSNDHNMFHGLSFAVSPSFLPGLTLFANRVCLVPWEWENLKYILPKEDNTIEDQKASFGFSWIFPQVGFEVYGELGIDDFVPDKLLGYVRHPFHTTVYTAGLKKVINIRPDKKIHGELIFESNWMEMTQDYQFYGAYSFYMHGLIKQGYTNRGQWLGSGSAWGGNSQYLAFIVYYPQGNSGIFIGRNNPDNNYLYKNAAYTDAGNIPVISKSVNHNKANFNMGISTNYHLLPNLTLLGGITYNLIINPFYLRTENPPDDNHAGVDVLEHNFSFQFAVKWQI